jgi:hypothetical protein
MTRPNTRQAAGVVLRGHPAAVVLVGPGDRTFVGLLKGADFVHFCTLGLAASQRVDTIYMAALQDSQVELVPASRPDLHPIAYPTEAALMCAVPRLVLRGSAADLDDGFRLRPMP